MTTTIGDLLKTKRKEIWTIHDTASVFDALVLMSEKEVGALPVLDEHQELVGIISERDYARKIALKNRVSKDTWVKDIMTPVESMYGVQVNHSVEECMVLVTTKRIRHLPVFEEKKFIGLISIGDLVKSAIADKEHLIDQLSSYIAGKYM